MHAVSAATTMVAAVRRVAYPTSPWHFAGTVELAARGGENRHEMNGRDAKCQAQEAINRMQDILINFY